MRSSQELAALREQAVRLRREGKSRREIKKILGFIGNGTLNQLLRDEPLPPERTGPGYAESRVRAAEGVRRYWASERPAREAARAAISAAAAAQFGELTDREIIVAGAIAYWCEGAKSKPYRIDVDAATRYWASVTAGAPHQFTRPAIKHHTPRTSRPGDNADYYGCLRVSVAKSSELYREISGWAHGVMSAKRRWPE
jgi:hypothetical protein